eukprot:gnl/MRDRNA2_/MRDRNA2_64323_c0_seq1.p1 gnl/MRDRNA2_/MRDRNA2_64323_c0~~gnl/MRDRNA2_/MRDRNA2_64323_c0_seq1.p1  ORF type:complete len:115 (+),score=18.91 gnl/MRDRNA2_/MRDRNA2_64323_c0_seq1:106-450(+)
MDYNGNNLLSIDEFVYCCSVMKGSAQRLDMALMSLNLFERCEDLRKIDMEVLKGQMQIGRDITSLRVELSKVASIIDRPYGTVASAKGLMNSTYPGDSPSKDINNTEHLSKARL